MQDGSLDLTLIRSGTAPCSVRKANVVKLMHRAGLADTHVANVVRASADGLLTVDQTGVREMIQMVQEREAG